jgi:hypothetical protein
MVGTQNRCFNANKLDMLQGRGWLTHKRLLLSVASPSAWCLQHCSNTKPDPTFLALSYRHSFHLLCFQQVSSIQVLECVDEVGGGRRKKGQRSLREQQQDPSFHLWRLRACGIPRVQQARPGRRPAEGTHSIRLAHLLLLLLLSPTAARPPLPIPSAHRDPATMKNDEGEVVDLYIPRKW